MNSLFVGRCLNIHLFYQVAMSNRLFTDDVPVAELPCMNCKRIEMGEYGCYNGQSGLVFSHNKMTVFTGICQACGRTPPSLAWRFPHLKKKQQPISEEGEESKET